MSDDSPEKSMDFTFEQPEHFPQATYTFENNEVTKEVFELGRKLFYDPILSVDSTVSCNTCHKQQTAFADPTHRVNHGINNRLGKRNSPGIANMAFLDFFFYDGGVGHLDFVPINAITSEVEMGSSLAEVVEKLSRSPLYKKEFEEAFGKGEIESQQVLHALAQFTVMLVSANSKYDKVQRGEQTFTVAELEGYNLFMKNCSACHSGELFTDNYFHNNGLDETFTKDPGRSIITESDLDAGKFKVPSLRNVALTPPYMHDGRFKTLEEVLNHYVHGVKYSSTLDVELIKDEKIGIELSDEERSKIITFINTLTDYEFISDKRFADPF